ncbi:hypothetical protein PAMP_007936 [Pampus punctatissimus]
MAMPQQKEACVWGPVPGRREEDKGRGEKGLYLRHTLWTSVWLDKKEEERKSNPLLCVGRCKEICERLGVTCPLLASVVPHGRAIILSWLG